MSHATILGFHRSRASAGRLFTAAFNIGDMLEADEAVRAHAPSPHRIVPVTTRWPYANTRRRARSSKASCPADVTPKSKS